MMNHSVLLYVKIPMIKYLSRLILTVKQASVDFVGGGSHNDHLEARTYYVCTPIVLKTMSTFVLVWLLQWIGIVRV